MYIWYPPRVCPDFGQSQGIAPTISLPEVTQRFKALQQNGIWMVLNKIIGMGHCVW